MADTLTLPVSTGKTARASLNLAGLLLLALLLLVLGLVPDEAVLRPKVAWGQGVALALVAAGLLHAARTGLWQARWPQVLIAGLVPGAIAILLLWVRPELSRSLALDETVRILLVSGLFWAVSVTLARPVARSATLTVLAAVTIPVAGYAVAQNLAGVLGLPLDRVTRATSTFGNPVFLGAFLVLATPVCMAGALFGRGALRWTGALATGLALPALLATASRWAWVGFAAAVATGIVLLAPTARQRRWLLAGLLAAGGLLAALNHDVLQRPQAHALIWRDTLRMALDHPLGVGPGQFPVAFLPYASPELLATYPRAQVIIEDAHSEPLQILVELGWAGLLAVLLWYALLLRAALGALRVLPPADAERPLLAAGTAALVGSAVQSLGSPDLRFQVSTLLFAILAGYVAATGARRFRDGAPAEDAPGGKALGLPARTLLAVAGLGLLGWAGYTTWDRVSIGSLVRPQDPFPAPSRDSSRLILGLLRRAELDGGNPAVHDALGIALARARRYHDAAVAFRRAATLAPDDADIVRRLGVVEGLAGEYESAIGHLRAALAAYPEDGSLRYLLAFCSYGLGDVATAVRELELLLAQHPDHPQGRLLLERLRE